VRTEFVEKLKYELTQPLPGEAAHLKMAPYRKLLYDNVSLEALNPRRGSVLVLLYPKDGEIATAYIKRTIYKGVHSGQVSFPGGKFEEPDITDEYTALRESNEEIGIDINAVEVIGELSKLYIPPSNFLVSPFVGYTNKHPEFFPDKREVETLIEVKLSTLIKSSDNIQDVQIKSSEDIIISAPTFEVSGYQIWGATAMITNEFVEVVKRTGVSF
jgi:8-oxo-dGTP pyrophosphatase MutT (NUDIX family)